MDPLGSLHLALWALEKGMSILCITFFFFFDVLAALRGMWDLSSLSRNPCNPLHWKGRVLTT